MANLKHLRCIKTNRLSQGFGESRACVYPESWKVISKINGVCPAGSVDLYNLLGLKAHNGYDRAAWFREPVYFSVNFDGWIKTEKDLNGGIGVDIVSKRPLLKCTEPNCNETHYIKQRLWHHWELPDSIWDGKEVKWGELVAYADSTGLSGGNHVHEGIKWCNEGGVGIHKNNGYYGAFDITKHPDVEVIDEFVLDYLRKQELEVEIREAQLTLIQILYKYIFILQEQIRKAVKSMGSIWYNNSR